MIYKLQTARPIPGEDADVTPYMELDAKQLRNAPKLQPLSK